MSLEQNKPLTNPFADSTNVVKVRIAETGDCEFLPLVLDLDIDGALLLGTSNQLVDTTLYSYISVRATDGDKELVTQLDQTNNAFPDLDLSVFDASKDWLFDIAYAPAGALGTDCPCHKSFTHKVEGTKANYNVVFDASQAVAVLEVEVNDTAVSDGASFTFPNAAINDVVLANVKLKNTGEANLVVQNIAISGDGSFSGYAQKNGALAQNDEYVFVTVQLDTSAVGAKTSTVSIATNEAANPLYAVDIKVTVV